MESSHPHTPSSPAGSAAPAAPAVARDLPGDPEKQRVEARLLRLENYLGFRPLNDEAVGAILRGDTALPPPRRVTEAVEGDLEGEIGEYWLARVGVIALCLGVAFLVAFPLRGVPAGVSSLIGFVAAGLFLVGAWRWRTLGTGLAGILRAGAFFLLFFATLRLHFFTTRPAIEPRGVVLTLLLLVLAGEMALAVNWGSQLLAGFVVVLALALGAMADSASFQFALMFGLAAVLAALVWRRNWPWLGLAGLVLVLLAHVDWLLSHPLLGRALRGVAAPEGNLLALAGCAVPFLIIGCRPRAQADPTVVRVGRALVLAGGVLLVVLINLALFPALTTAPVLLACGLFLLAGALACWWRQQSVYATGILACAGQLLLSVAIIRGVPMPASYAWLAWQSLLVAATAVTFRSRIILVANLFIFAGIYLAYLFLSPGSGLVNLSFALVALGTARLLNWRKERLELRTELMRNLYLGAAAVAIPYGLRQLVPPGWVSVAWLAAAGGYFLASAVLHNAKYRWLGIATVLATIVYVFTVDLAHLAPGYRILSFLVLGVVLLGISLAYARRRRQQVPDRNGGRETADRK